MGRISAANGVSMEGMINAGDVQQVMDDADDDAISLQPLVPYVGMTFDLVDDARQFYNAYAFRHWFGIRTSA